MAVRSVAELLPRDLDELTLADLPDILERAGEPRETLFFERKASVNGESLAKSCAAFANRLGGLLVVGVADKTDDIVGIESRGEAQLWVKDTLRGHVLPMPPFRARWIPLEAADRAVLLVLIAESSTTPHLHTRRGAIYVRNPGSSDPAPIADQQLLFDLIRRGERAADQAAAEARESAAFAVPDELLSWSFFAARATGVSDDHRARLFAEDGAGAKRVLRVLYDVYGESPGIYRSYAGPPVYDQHQVLFQRRMQRDFDTTWQVVAASQDGSIAVGHGFKADMDHSVDSATLQEQIRRALRATREFTLDFGGHGDLRIAWRFLLPEIRTLHVGQHATRRAIDAIVERAATLDTDEARDETLLADLVAEVARAGGVGPFDDGFVTLPA